MALLHDDLRILAHRTHIAHWLQVLVGETVYIVSCLNQSPNLGHAFLLRDNRSVVKLGPLGASCCRTPGSVACSTIVHIVTHKTRLILLLEYKMGWIKVMRIEEHYNLIVVNQPVLGSKACSILQAYLGDCVSLQSPIPVVAS